MDDEVNRTGLSQGLCESFTCDIPTPSGGRHPWVEQLLDRADQALYAAKRQGRDRFFSFEMQLDTVEQLAL